MPQGETRTSVERAMEIHTQVIERQMKIKLISIKMTDAEKKEFAKAKEDFQTAFDA